MIKFVRMDEHWMKFVRLNAISACFHVHMVPACLLVDKRKRLVSVPWVHLGDVQILDGIGLGRIQTIHASLQLPSV